MKQINTYMACNSLVVLFSLTDKTNLKKSNK